MKFRTEISIKPFARNIGYPSRIFAAGSCFAENIAERMRQAKFDVASNPTGILFNPASIAAALSRFADGKVYDETEIIEADGKWFSYDAHTSLDGHTKEEALRNLNEAVTVGHTKLAAADTVILTFGTAWIYELNETGRTVANCHKRPQSLFTRRRLSIAEIVETYAPLMNGILKDKHVIITVSPVRHTADGPDGNSASKAVLRLAADELAAAYPNVDYFPSFEIMNDDLRDYRFYDEDLVHPSRQAVEYIWEHFAKAALSDKARRLLPEAERIAAAARHRPFDPTGEAYREFCRKTVEAMDSMPEIDFSAEREILRRFYE